MNFGWMIAQGLNGIKLNSVMENLVFAHPRTGSTVLGIALGKMLGGKFLLEPFQNVKIDSTDSIDSYLSCWEENVGLKHVVAGTGRWPWVAHRNLTWSESLKFNKHLLEKFPKVIFLHRKDKFKTALSICISEQIGHWGCRVRYEDSKFIWKDEVLAEGLLPVSIARFNSYMKTLNNFDSIYGKFLKDSGREYLEVFYEDLFDDTEKYLQKVSDYIEVPINEEARELFDPKYKMNSESSYRAIPNIKEIYDKFRPKQSYFLM